VNNLAPDQYAAIDRAVVWHSLRDRPYFRLEGAAGTGKTSVASTIAGKCAPGSTAYIAPTGKAAAVLRSKGCEGATTVHAAIYAPAGERTAQIKALQVQLDAVPTWRTKDREILELAIAGAAKWQTGRPDALLTTVHRFGDTAPLIDLATALRRGRSAPRWDGTAGMTRANWSPGDLSGYDQVIVGRNSTRWQIVEALREAAGREPGRPEPGDRVMVLCNDPEADLDPARMIQRQHARAAA
jgi:exodeoxyribonuclease-5